MASSRLLIRATTSATMLGLLLAMSAGCHEAPATDGLEAVVIRDETFRLELAADPESRMKGLMGRERIPDDGGMLFVFPDVARRSFWMAYCLVDIDVIYLDARGRVTAAHRMKAEPPQGPDEPTVVYERRMRLRNYPSRLPAQFAIELKAGSLDRLEVRVDEKIELDLPRLKATAR